MVKGGCTCGSFQMAISHSLTEYNYNAAEWEIKSELFLLAAVYYCPWCGAKLTAPEEDGNVQKD